MQLPPFLITADTEALQFEFSLCILVYPYLFNISKISSSASADVSVRLGLNTYFGKAQHLHVHVPKAFFCWKK